MVPELPCMHGRRIAKRSRNVGNFPESGTRVAYAQSGVLCATRALTSHKCSQSNSPAIKNKLVDEVVELFA
jgi:hypothetical protein